MAANRGARGGNRRNNGGNNGGNNGRRRGRNNGSRRNLDVRQPDPELEDQDNLAEIFDAKDEASPKGVAKPKPADAKSDKKEEPKAAANGGSQQDPATATIKAQEEAAAAEEAKKVADALALAKGKNALVLANIDAVAAEIKIAEMQAGKARDAAVIADDKESKYVLSSRREAVRNAIAARDEANQALERAKTAAGLATQNAALVKAAAAIAKTDEAKKIDEDAGRVALEAQEVLKTVQGHADAAKEFAKQAEAAVLAKMKADADALAQKRKEEDPVIAAFILDDFQSVFDRASGKNVSLTHGDAKTVSAVDAQRPFVRQRMTAAIDAAVQKVGSNPTRESVDALKRAYIAGEEKLTADEKEAKRLAEAKFSHNVIDSAFVQAIDALYKAETEIKDVKGLNIASRRALIGMMEEARNDYFYKVQALHQKEVDNKLTASESQMIDGAVSTAIAFNKFVTTICAIPTADSVADAKAKQDALAALQKSINKNWLFWASDLGCKLLKIAILVGFIYGGYNIDKIAEYIPMPQQLVSWIANNPILGGAAACFLADRATAGIYGSTNALYRWFKPAEQRTPVPEPVIKEAKISGPPTGSAPATEAKKGPGLGAKIWNGGYTLLFGGTGIRTGIDNLRPTHHKLSDRAVDVIDKEAPSSGIIAGAGRLGRKVL